MRKKVYIIIILCFILILAKNLIFPVFHLRFYKENKVIEHFNENKKDFDYIVKSIQRKEVINIEKTNNKIVVCIDKRLENKEIVKQEPFTKELNSSCEKLFNGCMKLDTIWVEEYKNDKSLDAVKIKFIINSVIGSRKMQGVYYVENTFPFTEVTSRYIMINEHWYYFEEDWDDLDEG